jgi:hypothetical protein
MTCATSNCTVYGPFCQAGRSYWALLLGPAAGAGPSLGKAVGKALAEV